MRQLFLLVSVLLLGLSWAVAQNSPSQSTPDSSSSGQASSSQSSAGGEKTVEGCLSGSSGSYTLTAKNGTTYQLTGDTAKLSEHVGHEVKITGTPSSASSSTSSTGSAGSTAGSSSSQESLQVSSVKHVASSCQSGSGTMSH